MVCCRMLHACVLCGAALDDADHAVNACKATEVWRLITERHDAAVSALSSAVPKGALGACRQLKDVAHRTAESVPWVRKHAFLLPPAAHSIPDLVLIQADAGFRFTGDEGNAVYQHRWKTEKHRWEQHPGDRARFTLHIVEVKFKLDLCIPESVVAAQAQHGKLIVTLRQHWPGESHLASICHRQHWDNDVCKCAHS